MRGVGEVRLESGKTVCLRGNIRERAGESTIVAIILPAIDGQLGSIPDSSDLP